MSKLRYLEGKGGDGEGGREGERWWQGREEERGEWVEGREKGGRQVEERGKTEGVYRGR